MAILRSIHGLPMSVPINKPTSSKFTMAIRVSSANRSSMVAQEVTISHPLPAEKLEIFKSMEPWVETNILPLLKPVEKSWQPQDFLPEASRPGFFDEVREIMERAAGMPDEYFICLVGNMITEEALPTYQSMLNRFDGVGDESGDSCKPWAEWARRWSAEENRHGDLLNKYLYFTGKLNMRQIEKTIQYLIGYGMSMPMDTNPYGGLIYTSFQERATAISHGNTARHAKSHGDHTLAKICGTIAADEKLHEIAYTMMVEKLFEIDPDTTMVALRDMMKKRITMPALLMYDGQDERLFHHYSTVAQRIGVYTVKDYADIVEFLVKRWRIAGLTELSGEGRRAQDYVCGLAERVRRIEERDQLKRSKASQLLAFSWIFNRQVAI